jgi:small subunit ribosomal protein S2
MQDITLQALLEAGCHFGHKSERWHPKAAKFIYTEKDGIHIIDLAKTKDGLTAACEFVRGLASEGKEVLFVGTKRQAQGVVTGEATTAGAPFLTERWIGGFLTNWDTIHKNIEKINRMTNEQVSGGWKKFPKHEQTKMSRYLTRIKVYYGGVLTLDEPPAALFIVDVKKEIAAVREGIRRGTPIVAIVDTNSDPTGIDHVIPANDDAVGSISFITHAIAVSYKEGKEQYEKELSQKAAQAATQVKKEEVKTDAVEVPKEEKPVKEVKKSREEGSSSVGKSAKAKKAA